MPRTGQAGFTIIELVVVILLLGILTATALPRFLDISDDAHAAVVNAHVGALATATSLFRAAWFAKGQPSTQIDYDADGTLDLYASANGYPAGVSTVTDSELIEDNADCVEIFTDLIQDGGTSLQASAPASATAPTAGGSGAILNAGADWTGEEFAAIYVDLGTAGATTDDVCEYYYTGQFVGTGDTVRYISYTPDNGAISQTTAALSDFTP